MPGSLIRSLIESHTASARRDGREAALRPDHVVLEGHAATLALLYFEGMDRDRAPTELTLIGAGPEEGAARFERGAEQRYLRDSARRMGLPLFAPGVGSLHHLYTERHAAPGRLALATTAEARGAGGLAELVVHRSEIEVAAALAGSPPEPGAVALAGVTLLGVPPRWLGTEDLVMHLALRLGDLRGTYVEFGGDALSGLSAEARIEIARASEDLGVAGCLFPSDERTRAWLRAQGREADWKALATSPEAGDDPPLELELEALEPLVRGGSARDAAVPILDRAETPIGRVVIGPGAGLGDLIRFAALLRGRRVAAGTEVLVMAGSRQIAETARREGAFESLADSGARVLGPGQALPLLDSGRATLGTGLRFPARPGGSEGWLRAGLPACAATALAGRLADPRGLPPEEPGIPAPDSVTLEDTRAPRPASAGEAGVAPERRVADTRDGLAAPTPLPPLTTTLRGSVLLALGDRHPAARVLPAGARVWRERARIARLAEFAFADADPGFAARSRASGGGFVVAGEGFGAGAALPHAALALAELGVRAVLARSFASEVRVALVRHGVLPLVFASPGDAVELRTGDELELTGLPDALEPARPLVVRDLTRATQVVVNHDLDVRGIELIRAGGLQALVRGAPSRATAGA